MAWVGERFASVGNVRSRTRRSKKGGVAQDVWATPPVDRLAEVSRPLGWVVVPALLGPASGWGDDGAGGGDVVVVPDDPLVGALDAGVDGGLALRLGVDEGEVGSAG